MREQEANKLMNKYELEPNIEKIINDYTIKITKIDNSWVLMTKLWLMRFWSYFEYYTDAEFEITVITRKPDTSMIGDRK